MGIFFFLGEKIISQKELHSSNKINSIILRDNLILHLTLIMYLICIKWKIVNIILTIFLIICYVIRYIRKMLKIVCAHIFKLIDKRFVELMFLLQLFQNLLLL